MVVSPKSDALLDGSSSVEGVDDAVEVGGTTSGVLSLGVGSPKGGSTLGVSGRRSREGGVSVVRRGLGYRTTHGCSYRTSVAEVDEKYLSSGHEERCEASRSGRWIAGFSPIRSVTGTSAGLWRTGTRRSRVPKKRRVTSFARSKGRASNRRKASWIGGPVALNRAADFTDSGAMQLQHRASSAGQRTRGVEAARKQRRATEGVRDCITRFGSFSRKAQGVSGQRVRDRVPVPGRVVVVEAATAKNRGIRRWKRQRELCDPPAESGSERRCHVASQARRGGSLRLKMPNQEKPPGFSPASKRWRDRKSVV